jgi:hypothetical protein
MPPAPPLVVDGSIELKLGPGDQPYKPAKVLLGRTDDHRVQRAAADCLAWVVKQVVNRESEENRVRRRLEKQRHKQLLRDLANQHARPTTKSTICWDWVKKAGRPGACSRGEACPYDHELVRDIDTSGAVSHICRTHRLDAISR